MIHVLIRHRPDITPEAIDIPKHARPFGSSPSWAWKEWLVEYTFREDADLLVARLKAEPGVHVQLWNGYAVNPTLR